MRTDFDLPRLVTPTQAAVLELTRGRTRTELRRGNWQRLAAGVLLTGRDRPTRRDWLEVGLALGGPHAAATGWDAARLFGVGHAGPPDPLAVVLVPAGRNRVVGGVRIRRTSRPFTSTLIDLDTRVVSPARAVAGTALQYRTLRPVRALVSAAIQRRVCGIDDLLAELASMPQRGSRPFRLALTDVLDGARSVAEAEAVARLRRTALPRFELNAEVIVGERRYVVDLLWRELRLILEIDSREYHFSERDWQPTLERHNGLTAAAFAVVHYPPSQARRTGWVDEVAATVHARAAELGLATA